MQINSVGSNSHINNNGYKKQSKAQQSNPNFKGLGNLPGWAMQNLENSGFIGSFLVQDTLGMTVPRTREGLFRDVPEDKKKDARNWNFKEGAEVLIREGLSGPLMMFTPVAVLLLGKKFIGKSTFTNSSLIKRIGKTLTETVKGGAHDSAEALKNDFYRRNVTKIVQETTNAVDKAAESAFIDKAVRAMEISDKYAEKIANSSGRRKRLYKKAAKRHDANIIEMFNNYHISNNSDYSLVNKVSLDGGVFSTDKAITGIRSYAADALKNKKTADITEEFTEKLQKKSLTTRFITNALAAASTIGSVSLVPMLYSIINPVPPGSLANKANTSKSNEQAPVVKTETQSANKNNGQVSFTGKWDKLARHFEFDGNQLTPALMTTLAAGGLLAPRVHTAVKRAPEDPVTKKKDYSEVPEILTRDVTSTAAVTFGVPLLAKGIVSSYEYNSGFVLQTKPNKPMTAFRKVLDKLNPFSSIAPYSLNDLNHIYGKVDSVEKLGTFSKFINDNNGSIAKVFDTIKESKDVFAEHGLDIKELAKQKDRKAANQAIIDKMANSEFANKLVELIKPAKDGKANNMLKRARSLNSYTSFAATFFLVPAFLGIVLPRMVYGLTEKRQKKMAEAKAAMNASQDVQQVAITDNSKVDYSRLMTTANNQTFAKMKHQ